MSLQFHKKLASSNTIFQKKVLKLWLFLKKLGIFNKLSQNFIFLLDKNYEVNFKLLF